jgi:hypothetical protein
MTLWCRAKRAIATVAALALVAGAWHGPSMMIAAAMATAIDCHPGMMLGDHTAHDANGPPHTSNASDAGAAKKHDSFFKVAFACPFGTMAGLETFVAEPARAVAATMIEARQPKALLSVALDRPDPPPRTAS